MQFFDINKFKPGKGILWLPISLARIDNAQSAKAYFEDYIPHITPAKILTPTIWANFCYSDWLYMRDQKSASTLKYKYTKDICKHENECSKYIWKPQVHLGKTHKDVSFYVPQAFSFSTRSSLYFWYRWDFASDLATLYKIYQQDDLFQKYLIQDCIDFNKEPTETQILFFLEEHLMMYFIAKRRIELENKYVPNHDRVLLSYPWKPPKHMVYLMQQDFFTLSNERNVYAQCRYDLADKKLYDLTKINIDTHIF
jgi:hypothetical protein